MKKTPKNFMNASPLELFCDRYKISRRELSEIAGGTANGAGRSTVDRLLHNELKPDYTARLRKILAERLPMFLLSRGLTPAEINDELTKIFTKGEFQPMITERIELNANAQKWFGLSDDPFGINLSSVADVFISPELQEIFDRIIDAIKFQGFVAVTGEIGAGKTVLRAWLEEHLAENNNLKLIFPATENMGKVSPASISRAILREFGYGKIPVDSVERSKTVKSLLAEKKGISVAIAFDECHKLNPTTLSSLKNFLEMNSGGFRRFLGVVLFGQPTFENELANSREIKERLTVLKMPEFEHSAIPYLEHRLSLVGGKAEDIFDTDAHNIIAANAKTPLQLGNIANKAMLNSMQKPYESKQVLGGIIRATMSFAITPAKRQQKLSAVK